jgi:methylmalonyl-CoA epimerase
MEIGDIFVINKADREGVYATEKEIEALLSLSPRRDSWQPPIVKTVATENKGIDELTSAIESYRESHLKTEVSSDRRQAIARWRILELLRERLISQTLDSESASERLNLLAGEVATRQRDPYSAVEELLETAAKRGHSGGTLGSNDMDFVEANVQSSREQPTVDHIGIATEELLDVAAFWQDVLHLSDYETEEVSEQGVKVAMLPVGESRVELLEPTTPESPIAKFLKKRGPGIHHIAIRVTDIEATLRHLKAKGARLIDETPRVGAGGCLVAFIHPTAANGVLVELVQHQ